MGRTIQDILENDLGLDTDEGSVKVASQEVPESDEIEKLAALVGLAPEGDSTPASKEEKQTGQTKEAQMSLESLYGNMFPGDGDVVASVGSEKVASQEKIAAEKEAAMGAVAFDAFAECVDGHITKLAEELTGDATVSTSVDEATDGKPVQTMKDNQPANSAQGMDTAPSVENLVTAQKGGEVVGTEEQRAPAGNGEQLKEAAMRKAWVASLVEDEE